MPKPGSDSSSLPYSNSEYALMRQTRCEPKDTQMFRLPLPQLRDEPEPVSSALLGENPLVHSGEDVFQRNQLNRPGIDLIKTALDLDAPGSLNSSGIVFAGINAVPQCVGQEDALF